MRINKCETALLGRSSLGVKKLVIHRYEIRAISLSHRPHALRSPAVTKPPVLSQLWPRQRPVHSQVPRAHLHSALGIPACWRGLAHTSTGRLLLSRNSHSSESPLFSPGPGMSRFMDRFSSIPLAQLDREPVLFAAIAPVPGT